MVHDTAACHADHDTHISGTLLRGEYRTTTCFRPLADAMADAMAAISKTVSLGVCSSAGVWPAMIAWLLGILLCVWVRRLLFEG